MTLAQFAVDLMHELPRERSIVKMVAFLGRYGRQPRSEVMRMPIGEALALMEEVAQLMKEESPEQEE